MCLNGRLRPPLRSRWTTMPLASCTLASHQFASPRSPDPGQPKNRADTVLNRHAPVYAGVNKNSLHGRIHDVDQRACHYPSSSPGGICRRRRGAGLGLSSTGHRQHRSDQDRLLAGVDGSEFVDRHRHQPRHRACGRRDQRRRRHRRPPDRARGARHPERPDQGGQRGGRAHPASESGHHLWPAQFGRGAGGDAVDRARQGPDASSMLGRPADRRQEVPDGLPPGPDQPADRRRGEPICGRCAEAEKGRGRQRHHRLRHGLGRCLCADAESQGRRGGVLGPYRRRQSRPQTRHAADAERRRRRDHAVERERGLSGAHPQYPRRDGLGRAGGRPDHARLRPDQGAAGEAGILEQGLLQQLPQCLLQQGRQVAGARGGIRRAAAQGQARHGRHAAVVDRARL